MSCEFGSCHDRSESNILIVDISVKKRVIEQKLDCLKSATLSCRVQHSTATAIKISSPTGLHEVRVVIEEYFERVNTLVSSCDNKRIIIHAKSMTSLDSPRGVFQILLQSCCIITLDNCSAEGEELLFV